MALHFLFKHLKLLFDMKQPVPFLCSESMFEENKSFVRQTELAVTYSLTDRGDTL